MQRAVIGKHAPKFRVEAVFEEDFVDIELEKYRGKYVVLLFYQQDFTPISRSEVVAFSQKIQEFSDLNCQVLAISTDSKYTHLAWTTMPPPLPDKIGELAMPLLSDHAQTVSRNYGIFLQGEGHSQSATFIIDRDGILRQSSFYDPKIGRSVEETVRLLKAIQGVDQQKEVVA